MVGWLLSKIIGTKNEREIKKLKPFVKKINELEEELFVLTNKELVEEAKKLHSKVRENEALKEEIIRGEINQEVLLGFALVKEVSKRTLGLRPFDVQILGGLVLHQGKIAEMKTGEGKTLVATMPIFINALTDEGVHLVTVNDYLARRDALWMGPIYLFLGLSVGVINSGDVSYRVSWVEEERVREAIEGDLRVWPKDFKGEILPPERTNAVAKKIFMTKLESSTRREAYLCSITYGTNNEFGFDYLKDNLAISKEQIVQVKGHNYAIIDEIDSILIDEARTPLIISGPALQDVEIYKIADSVVRRLKRGQDFEVDEKNRNVLLKEEGIKKIERILGIKNLYDLKYIDLLHAINQSLKAHHLFKRDVDYIVRDGEVLIVDEFTGRVLPGRRWSEGLHQAIEVKEGVPIKEENQTLASITFQNYFKLYKKLAGMTGTAETEALEFKEIYNLDVVVIPTHKPMIRKDHPDLVFKTKKEKWLRVVREILLNHLIGRPVLVGTVSIEDNEHLSSLLKNKKLIREITQDEKFLQELRKLCEEKGVPFERVEERLSQIRKKGVPHQVLNAKHHEREAEIIAQAGRVGAITIATNMAGRGTDILLGGNPEYLAKEILKGKGKKPEEATEEEWKEALNLAYSITSKEKEEVLKLGGLYVIGTQRHESRRIDNQLRGRSGRQGDPGESRFILSLEDDLIRLFGGDRVKWWMEKLKVPEGEPIESKLVSKAIENAQKRVEAQNFQIRKRLLEFDEVINSQREAVYSLRREILEGKSLKDEVEGFIEEILRKRVYEILEGDEPESWDFKALKDYLKELTGRELDLKPSRDKEEVVKEVVERVKELYREKREELGEIADELERVLALSTLDNLWREHLYTLDHLREGIHLRGYAHRDPLVEYKRESYELFEEMMNSFKESLIRTFLQVVVESKEEVEREIEREEERQREVLSSISISAPTQERRQTLRERLKRRRMKRRR